MLKAATIAVFAVSATVAIIPVAIGQSFELKLSVDEADADGNGVVNGDEALHFFVESFRPSVSRTVRLIDTNGNGVITLNEALGPATTDELRTRAEAQFARLDRTGNGIVPVNAYIDDGLQQIVPRLEGMVSRLVADLDKNGDGVLAVGEIDQASSPPEAVDTRDPFEDRPIYPFDGLDQTEFAEVLRRVIVQQAAAQIEQIDVNGDGFIQRDEAAATWTDPIRQGLAFERQDVGGDGRVEIDALKREAALAVSPSVERAASRLFEQADANGNGTITREEFEGADLSFETTVR